MIGKTFRYTTFAACVLVGIHMGFLKMYERPESEALFFIYPFSDVAKFINFSAHDFMVLMTKPGMTKMLPDRMNIPGM